MAGGQSPHAFPPDQFSRHHQLLRRKVWFMNPSQGEFRQMASEFFRKFPHGCKPRMQDFANSVVESRNADVIWNSDSRFLQRLVDTRSGLVCTHKKRCGAFSAGQQGLYGQISEFAILGTDLAEPRLKVGLFHRLAVARGTAREPR